MEIQLPTEPPRTRREFADAVRMLHGAYLEASQQSALRREQRDPYEKAFETAVELVCLAADVDGLTPIDDIRIGDQAKEGAAVARILDRTRIWDLFATEAVERFQRSLVLRMRILGQSWEKIGSSLGMSGQGASKKAHEKMWVILDDKD